ncbi:MAG: type II toxin-antitoxin system RatA family toxin [Alphaproteobacteria bacterium]|nr:MAG: type II toxin-antitoxin system RatA family toxin [Alphaproteobacteria bacterium]
MPIHKETRKLPYTAEQMFAVVADVAAYKEFLPWCVGTRIRAHETRPAAEGHAQEILTADLAVRFKMFRETFTSRAVLDRHHQTIRVEYLDGPFEYLENDWTFRDVEEGSEIDFFIEFRFRSFMLERMIAGMFEEAVERMVAAFETRADALYRESLSPLSGA